MTRKQWKSLLFSFWKKLLHKQPKNENVTLHQFKISLQNSPIKERKCCFLRRLFLLRERIRQQRRIRKESFVSPAKIKILRHRIRPYLLGVCFVTLFFAVDAPMRIGIIFRDIAMFKVQNLRITGCQKTSTKEIARLAGIIQYQSSLLELHDEILIDRIEQEDWIDQAVVTKKWPDEITIEITERIPVALVNGRLGDKSGLFYVDKNGEIFHQVQPGDDLDYPVITGHFTIEHHEKDRDVFVEFADIKTFLKKVARNNPNLPEQSISEIYLDEQKEMVVYLVDHPFPIFFGKGNIITKYSRLVKVMNSLYHDKESETLLSGISYIQMDYLHDKVLVAR